MTPTDIPKKRGQLSTEEQKYIRDNISTLGPTIIATNLNRTVGPIDRYIKENNLFLDTKELKDLEYLKDKLKVKTFWGEIQKQFDNESGELQYFEDTWVNLIKQFREDVLPAEELQIKQFITIDILINRSMKDRKRHISDTEKLQELVDKEYSKPEQLRDPAALMNMETQLSFARNSIASYTNEYTKLLNEQQKISKDLKATREQRIKRIEDGKSSWTGLIRMLEEEKIREIEGRQMEIISLAAKNSKGTLMEYHQYQDGTLDNPFLTPESVLKNNS